MFKNFRVLSAYYRLSKTNWKIIAFEFVILLIPSLLSIISPILTAHIISSITVFNFKQAVILLTLDFVIILATALFYFAYHFISGKISKKILLSTNEYVYEKIKNNPSIDKINSSTMNEIWDYANFNNFFLYKICFLIKSIIILTIVFSYNFFIGISLLIVSMLSAALLSLTNKQIQTNTVLLNESKANCLEFFNSIQKGVSQNTDTTVDKNLKSKYFEVLNRSIKTNDKITLFYSLNNNFITLILKTAVFLLTFYLITLVKSTSLSLSSYLILTPYLTSSAQNLIAFFEVFPEIGMVDNIINEFQNLSADTSPQNNVSQTRALQNFKLQFFHIGVSTKNYTIKDFSAEVDFKAVIQVVGDSNCGKRAIFDLLSKKITAENGSIFIGEININNIPEEDYSKLVGTTSKSPYFYNISVLDNLLMVGGNKNKIEKSLKELGLEQLLDKLPNGLGTIIENNIDEKFLFFLGLAKLFLAKPKIACIYEIPGNFDATDFELFFKILQILKMSATVILFLHDELKIPSSKVIHL